MPTSRFFSLGDCIGDESCADMTLIPLLERAKANEDDAAAAVERRMTMRRSQRWEVKEKMKGKEYPPPIPLLARTENLHSYMPWVLQRKYTSDGRLILSEERVKHHEYFRADRRDGRLTLQLVPLDDQVFDGYIDDEPGETEHDDSNVSLSNCDNGNIDRGLCGDHRLQSLAGTDDDDDDGDGKMDEMGSVADDVEPLSSPKATVDVSGGVGKCLHLPEYNIGGGINAIVSGRGSPSTSHIFGVPVSTIV